MDFKTIRTRFIQATGRADLENADGTDNGAGVFINAGQRFLDQRQTTPGTKAAHVVVLPAGSYYALVPELRYAEEVWATVGASGRVRLARKLEREIREAYPRLFEAVETGHRPPSVQLASLCTGAPLYWSPMTVTVAPGQRSFLSATDTFGQPQDVDGLIFGESWAHRGILIAPPTDAEMTLRVEGSFWSPRLTADTDSSWWSMLHPETLVFAAAYVLETHYRNSTGAKDWLATIDEMLRGIRADEAMSEMAGITEMGG